MLLIPFRARLRFPRGGRNSTTTHPPALFLEVLILGSFEPFFLEVLIIEDFNWPRMSEIQNMHKFLEVLILKGLKCHLSPP